MSKLKRMSQVGALALALVAALSLSACHRSDPAVGHMGSPVSGATGSTR